MLSSNYLLQNLLQVVRVDYSYVLQDDLEIPFGMKYSSYGELFDSAEYYANYYVESHYTAYVRQYKVPRQPSNAITNQGVTVNVVLRDPIRYSLDITATVEGVSSIAGRTNVTVPTYRYTGDDHIVSTEGWRLNNPVTLHGGWNLYRLIVNAAYHYTLPGTSQQYIPGAEYMPSQAEVNKRYFFYIYTGAAQTLVGTLFDKIGFNYMYDAELVSPATGFELIQTASGLGWYTNGGVQYMTGNISVRISNNNTIGYYNTYDITEILQPGATYTIPYQSNSMPPAGFPQSIDVLITDYAAGGSIVSVGDGNTGRQLSASTSFDIENYRFTATFPAPDLLDDPFVTVDLSGNDTEGVEYNNFCYMVFAYNFGGGTIPDNYTGDVREVQFHEEDNTITIHDERTRRCLLAQRDGSIDTDQQYIYPNATESYVIDSLFTPDENGMFTLPISIGYNGTLPTTFLDLEHGGQIPVTLTNSYDSEGFQAILEIDPAGY
jgi:hypothetical protein